MPLYHRFQCMVDHLTNCAFPGKKFASASLEVSDEQSSFPASSKPRVKECNDRFKLHIPFAGHTLVWEVRFDVSHPLLAPDFLFDDELFTLFLNVDVISNEVPSLLNWDVKQHDSLFNVVQELLNVYTDYQLKMLSDEGSALEKDCLKLKKELGIKRNQLQVLQGGTQLIPQFSSCASRPSKDTISIILYQFNAQIDFESIAEEFCDFALQFHLQDYSEDEVILHINPVLSMLLGHKEELIIPNYSKTSGFYEYIKNFKDIMKSTIKMVESDISKREEFHASLFYELDEMARGEENFSFKPIESSLESSRNSYLMNLEWFWVILQAETLPRATKPKVFLRTITGGAHEVELDSSTAWDPQKIMKVVMRDIIEMREKICISFNQ